MGPKPVSENNIMVVSSCSTRNVNDYLLQVARQQAQCPRTNPGLGPWCDLRVLSLCWCYPLLPLSKEVAAGSASIVIDMALPPLRLLEEDAATGCTRGPRDAKAKAPVK